MDVGLGHRALAQITTAAALACLPPSLPSSRGCTIVVLAGAVTDTRHGTDSLPLVTWRSATMVRRGGNMVTSTLLLSCFVPNNITIEKEEYVILV